MCDTNRFVSKDNKHAGSGKRTQSGLEQFIQHGAGHTNEIMDCSTNVLRSLRTVKETEKVYYIKVAL